MTKLLATSSLATSSLITALALVAVPAFAQSEGDPVSAPLEAENVLDGQGNIAGTDGAIGKSDIPMEGAVADTMGEALALDKATDRFETGRPAVALKDGYELIEFNDMTLDEVRDAPIFGLDDKPAGRIEDMNAPERGKFEGLVTIDGPEGSEPRRVRVPSSRMQAVRDDTGAARIYIDTGDEAMSTYEAG